jgi:hypothetical protein
MSAFISLRTKNNNTIAHLHLPYANRALNIFLIHIFSTVDISLAPADA